MIQALRSPRSNLLLLILALSLIGVGAWRVKACVIVAGAAIVPPTIDSIPGSGYYPVSCTITGITFTGGSDTDILVGTGNIPEAELRWVWTGHGYASPTAGTFGIDSQTMNWELPSSHGQKDMNLAVNDASGYNNDTPGATQPVAATNNPLTAHAVKVKEIQYKGPNNADWTTVTGPLHILKGTAVQFKAIPEGANTWPANCPAWTGTSGATGTNETTSVTFGSLSDAQGSIFTSIASCGASSSVTTNSVVYDLTAVHIAQETFTGRSTIKYGVAEISDLTYTTTNFSPSAGQIGGLLWTVASGGGSRTNTGTSGVGTYTAPGIASAGVTIRLTIQAGPSKGKFVDAAFDVVAPSGTRMTRVNPNTVWHETNKASAGIKLYYWLDPKDVTFQNVTFGVGSVGASAVSGHFTKCEPLGSYPNGDPMGEHTQNTFGPINSGNSTDGCRVNAPDYARCGPAVSWEAGSFTWAIPTQYIHNSTRYTFGAASTHVSTFDVNGKATQAKANQSGEANLNAASSDY